MTLYPAREMERVMRVQEVILRAISGEIKWFQAAEILGVSPRTMRRYREGLEKYDYKGLYDRRTRRPSPKRVPIKTVEKVLRLYREEYFDFNVKHFHEKLVAEHGIELSYTWVKNALQGAGLVAKRSKRGRHYKRRPRRPLEGMLIHVDGSKHAWLGPNQGHQDLITLLDDATSEIYYAQLVEEESTVTVMRALRDLVEQKGVFCSLYSDRASHFVFTPKAGERPDRAVRTQLGRALDQLGIELIPANSPQARGRCERAYGTLQGRLPQELRKEGITTIEEANRYLRETFVVDLNRRFMVEPAEPGSAFVPYTGVDLNKIFSRQHERVVGNDNTVAFNKLRLQIEPQSFRFSMAKCRVLVCDHLDGTITLYYGPHQLGHYDTEGGLISNHKPKPTSNAA